MTAHACSAAVTLGAGSAVGFRLSGAFGDCGGTAVSTARRKSVHQ
jgi:hypothetical protein